MPAQSSLLVALSASCNRTHAAGEPSSSRPAPSRPCVRQPAAHRHGTGQQQQEPLLHRCRFAGAPLPRAVAFIRPRRPSTGEQHQKEPCRASTPPPMRPLPWPPVHEAPRPREEAASPLALQLRRRGVPQAADRLFPEPPPGAAPACRSMRPVPLLASCPFFPFPGHPAPLTISLNQEQQRHGQPHAAPPPPPVASTRSG